MDIKADDEFPQCPGELPLAVVFEEQGDDHGALLGDVQGVLVRGLEGQEVLRVPVVQPCNTVSMLHDIL